MMDSTKEKDANLDLRSLLTAVDFDKIKIDEKKLETGGRAMMQNVCSTTERIVRVIIGLAILSFVYFLRDQGAVRYWGLVGFTGA